MISAQTDLVTVIIPSYNRAHCIEAAVHSALRQTHAAMEVIVVDDGSSDATPEVMRKLAAAEPRVVYIRQANGGVSSARNAGLRAARGAFVALLDSDDVFLPWKIELQLRCLARFPEAGMIWTDMQAVAHDGHIINPKFLRVMYGKNYRWFPSNDALFARSERLSAIIPENRDLFGDARAYCGDISAQMIMGNLVHTSTVLIRRDRLEAVGLFNELLRPAGEDYDFHLRTCRLGPVAFADISTIDYAWGGDDQITHSRNNLATAKNFLGTIEGALGDKAYAAALPPWMVTASRAQAHAWIGQEALATGNLAEARTHLAQSLKQKPYQPAVLALYALSRGPRSSFPAMRTAVRGGKYVVALARRGLKAQTS